MLEGKMRGQNVVCDSSGVDSEKEKLPKFCRCTEGEEEQSIGKEVDFPRLPLVTLTVAIQYLDTWGGLGGDLRGPCHFGLWTPLPGGLAWNC